MSNLALSSPTSWGSTLRYGATRGRIANGSTMGMMYPSPFFDMAQTYMPSNIKEMFKFSTYYYTTFGPINAGILAFSQYPVTDVVWMHQDTEIQKLWTTVMNDQLDINSFRIDCNVDENVFGNVFVSVLLPFEKYLFCKHCTWEGKAAKTHKHWRCQSAVFRLTCPKCGNEDSARVEDRYWKNLNGIKLIRWNPNNITIHFNEVTHERRYFYRIPPTLRNDVFMGRKGVVETLPQNFIEAVREDKVLAIAPDNIYHMHRPALSGFDAGWGLPLIFPILKDGYHAQIMRRAQEVILNECIVPMRILFPQAGSGTSDVYSSVNLADWKEYVSTEFARWRVDNAYVPMSPLPIGAQTIGGDGKMMFLTNEIREHLDTMLLSMGIPPELFRGGTGWQGSTTAMRQLENKFHGNIRSHNGLLRFIVRFISTHMGYEAPKHRLKAFRSADDLQRKALQLQMIEQGMPLSIETFFSDMDLELKTELQRVIMEGRERNEATKVQQIGMAEIQGEAMLVQTKWQVKAQQVQMAAQSQGAAEGEPGGPEGGAPGTDAGGMPTQGQQPQPQQPQAGGDLAQQLGTPGSKQQMQQDQVAMDQQAQATAARLQTMSPALQQQAVRNLQTLQPQLAQLVQFYMQQGQVSTTAA